MYKGEDWDGRVEAALKGWSSPEYNGSAAVGIIGPTHSSISRNVLERLPAVQAGLPSPVWVAAIAPAVGPAVSTHAHPTTYWSSPGLCLIGCLLLQAFGSKLNAHHADNIIPTKESFTATNLTEPIPGRDISERLVWLQTSGACTNGDVYAACTGAGR